MSDLTLMQHIKDLWGARISNLPIDLQAFVAALIANESGGNANAKRLEPSVFKRLSQQYPNQTLEWLQNNATSWGLTQIMGYHVQGAPERLSDPDFSLSTTVNMLKDFQKQFGLLDTDHANLFRCWNTGHPSGQTYDPNYVTNGLERMAIWNQIEEEA